MTFAPLHNGGSPARHTGAGFPLLRVSLSPISNYALSPLTAPLSRRTARRANETHERGLYNYRFPKRGGENIVCLEIINL